MQASHQSAPVSPKYLELAGEAIHPSARVDTLNRHERTEHHHAFCTTLTLRANGQRMSRRCPFVQQRAEVAWSQASGSRILGRQWRTPTCSSTGTTLLRTRPGNRSAPVTGCAHAGGYATGGAQRRCATCRSRRRLHRTRHHERARAVGCAPPCWNASIHLLLSLRAATRHPLSEGYRRSAWLTDRRMQAHGRQLALVRG